jgi:cell division protein FtsZ
MADEVLHSGVRGVTDLMVKPGLINLDFADIRTVMREMGKAMMGTGEATGERRAIEAAEAAISNPLLDDVSLKGARAALINITGGPDMTLFEVDEAANRIREEVDPDANIIFGSAFNDSMEGRMRVSVVATGIEPLAAAQPRGATNPIEAKKPYLFSVARPETPKPAPRPVFAPAAAAPAPVAAEPKSVAVEPRPAINARAPEPVMAQPAPVAMAMAEASEPLSIGALAVLAPPPVAEAPVLSVPKREPREDSEEVAARSLFARIAEVSRSLAPRADAPASRSEQPDRQLQVTEKSRSEPVKKSAGSEEDQFLDIPAFLRRQAN